jgi:predicted GNAT family acetyltransferase
MRVHASGDVEEYAAAVEAFLKADPCARNVLLTIIDLVRSAPQTYAAAPSFWWVANSDAVVGAATWTPPHHLLVSSLPPEAVGDLVTAAIKRSTALGLRLGGVNGPADSARDVAAAWTSATDDTIERDRTILLNELVSLAEVPAPPGARRHALAEDVPLIAGWLDSFSAEVEHPAPTNALAMAGHMVHSEHVDVWVVDGEVVCMVGYRDAAGVARIGPVYTPPAHRNRGYGRRLTYEVTALAIQRPDIEHAMLFTDAANPVSNSIYRQAGYQPRGEHVEIEFAKRGVAPGH